MGKFRDYVNLIRPNVCLLAVFGVIVGYLLSPISDSRQFPDNMKFFAAVLAAFLVCGAGNVINDYFDYKIDKINAPNRPIPSGTIKRKNALIFYIALSIIGLALAFYVSTQFFEIALVNVVVLSAYGWKLKRSLYMKNAAVSWLSSSSFVAGGLVENVWITPAIAMISVISFLGTFSREVFKDVEDMKGDKKQRVRTFATIFGKTNAVNIASFLVLIALISVTSPYFTGTYPPVYMLAASPGIVLGLFAIYFRKNAGRSQKSLKMSMYCVVIAFIIMALL
jgi:geranylgeranylglycerol-phosphate geranylgeranyltransferase